MISSLIANIRIVDSDEEALAGIVNRSPQKNFVLTFINAHAANLFYDSNQFQRAVLNSDLILRDGSGMRILYRWLGLPAGKNMNGTDFIPKILAAFPEHTIALYGASDQALRQAEHKLKAMNHKVIDCLDGFQDPTSYLENSLLRRPQIIVLAMGMPKQELLAQQLKQQLETPTLIINGGGIVDFISGQKQRAPLWLRRIGMEWSYRLFLEPKRLWRRYIVGNVCFLWRMLHEKRGSVGG